MDFPRFELLRWRNPLADQPDTDITVALVTAEDGFISGHWDDLLKLWIDDASGAAIANRVLAWADPAGPEGLCPIKPADVPVDQVRAALHEALELVRGWVAYKCPKRHQAEHLAVVDALAKAGGL